jgi:hypothetical protein
MNDLELEGATHEAAQHIEKDTEQQTGRTEAEQEEDDFLDPRCVIYDNEVLNNSVWNRE